jgi:hyperosmotically inducible periplasmic protein
VFGCGLSMKIRRALNFGRTYKGGSAYSL